MYTPSHFVEDRDGEIQRILTQFPLATLIAETSEGLVANHIPMLCETNREGRMTLVGHIARANSLGETAMPERDVLAIFRAEHAYISPNWYPSKAEHHSHVPTWNYQVVHCYGRVRVSNESKHLRRIVSKLTTRFETETNGDAAWRMGDAPADYMEMMIGAITAVEIDVSRVIAKSKLSQNRESGDFEGVIENLNKDSPNPLAQTMKTLMDQK